ncbi:hypothetical protein ACWDUC_37500 [Streptomyces tricolor]
MSLLNKIKILLGRRPAQLPASDRNDETRVGEPPTTPAADNGRGEGPGLKGAITRGTAEGGVRESLRELFDKFGDE